MRDNAYVIAYDPGRRLVYGVGRTAAEAYDDAEFQACVVLGAARPWGTLVSVATNEAGAQAVLAGNGPVCLDRVERAASEMQAAARSLAA